MMSIGGLQFNWVDAIIVFVFAFFIYEGFKHGFLIMLADLVSLAISILLALKLYPLVSSVLIEIFPIPSVVANAIGFIILAIIFELGFVYLFGHLVKKAPRNFKSHPLNKYLSFFPAVLQALLIVAFVLVIIVGLPITLEIKKDFIDSAVGGTIIARAKNWNPQPGEIFGGVAEEAISYLTIEPSVDNR